MDNITGYNDTIATATYLGTLTNVAGSTYNKPATGFYPSDSVGYGTSDPYDYFRFDVPTASRIKISLSGSAPGFNDVYQFWDNLKSSSSTFSIESTSNTVKQETGEPLGTDSTGPVYAIYNVNPGSYTVGVSGRDFTNPNAQINYTLQIDFLSANSSSNNNSNNNNSTNTNNNSTNNNTDSTTNTPVSPVKFTDTQGTTWVSATANTFAYHYRYGDTVHQSEVYTPSPVEYQAISHHMIKTIGGPSTLFSLKETFNNVVALTDKSSGKQLVSFENYEGIQFADKLIYFLNADHANIARLYSAALGRAPDAAGLDNWTEQYDKTIPASVKNNVYTALAQTAIPASGTSIAAGFTNSLEFKNKYGALNDTQFVTQLYNNVLGRGPEAAGLNGWLNNMHYGDANGVHYTREMVLVGFAESPENTAKVAKDWLMEIY